jgi:hypothetical protein
MTEAGHEDRMLLALEPAAFVDDLEPAVQDPVRVPRSRHVSHGRIVDHFLTKLEPHDDDDDALETMPIAARFYVDV